MRIALDATYSVDPKPSGIAVYTRLLTGKLSHLFPDDQFIRCFRLKQWRQVIFAEPRSRLLMPPLPTFRADLFHALNQRVDRRPAPVIVTTFHDLFVMSGEYSTPEFRARFTQQARLAAANSDFIIAVSQFTATQVADLLPFDRTRIRVVHHGVQQRGVSVFERKREPIILFVGALQVRKNVSRLVAAFEGLPAPWRLVLAGSTAGFGATAILERVARSRSRDRIEVTGYRSDTDLAALYAKASLFVFPSLDEGFGLPVLEAMAWGVPVITSQGSALAEVAGDAALLVNPHDVGAISAALQTLIADRRLQKHLTDKGILRARQFTWERTARETYEVYREASRFR